MTNSNFLRLAGVLGTALTLGACQDIAGSDGARVSLLLTDAPADLKSATVKVSEIYLQGGADDASPHVVLYSAGGTFDLLKLQNGVAAELAKVTVPAGTYSQLRLVVADATLETLDGRTFSTDDGSLKCPSCAQSGLKIRLPDGGLKLTTGDNKLIIDFDVAQSFGHEAGKSGMWIMHPVVAASRVELAGAIGGTVTLAQGVTLPNCGGAPVTIAKFIPTAKLGDLTLSGTTDAAGALKFAYLAAGTYTLGAQQVIFGNGDKLTFAATPSVATLVVTPGATATVNYTITAATCQLAT
jgi:hypothetical protein